MSLKDTAASLARAVGRVAEAAARVSGEASLRSAYVKKQAPTTPGVYGVYYRGQLMKVGKAADGLRKRFSDYYRGQAGGTAGLKYITVANRDQVNVQWLVCPKQFARRIEIVWYDRAKARGEEMPWSSRR